jgi:hypothetical protein
MLMVSGFYSFGITILAHNLPDSAKVQIGLFSDNQINLEDTQNEIEGGLTKQTNLPVIELAALVFYSGNLVLDLLLNFLFAIPEMITLLVNIICIVFSLDKFLITQIQLFSGVLFSIMYFIALIQLVLGLRSGASSFL